MKMNSLDALMRVCEAVSTPAESMLVGHMPRPYAENINGKTVAQAGCVPILHMRDFQRDKRLSDVLVNDIITRNKQ